MSRLPELHRILVAGARRLELEERAARRSLWGRLRVPHLRRSTLIVALVLLGASTAGGVVAISGTRSKPLQGTFPPSVTGVLGERGRVAGLHYAIGVFPSMEAGWSGWCGSFVVSFHHLPLQQDFGCGAQERADPPVLESGSLSLEGATHGYEEAAYEIVAPRVAAARYPDGQVILPVAEPGLPAGWRAVVYVGPSSYTRVLVSGGYATNQAGVACSRTAAHATSCRCEPGVSCQPRHSRPRWEVLWAGPVVPALLDAHGSVIPNPETTRAENVFRLPVREVDASNPPHVPCSLWLVGGPRAARALDEQLATLPSELRKTTADTLLSCANAVFSVHGQRVAAAVLLSAGDPGGAPPALPGLAREPHAPGLLVGHALGNIGFKEGFGVGMEGTESSHFFATANRDITARRAGPAWLVAQGGTPADRAALLAALQVQVP